MQWPVSLPYPCAKYYFIHRILETGGEEGAAGARGRRHNLPVWSVGGEGGGLAPITTPVLFVVVGLSTGPLMLVVFCLVQWTECLP